MFTPQQIDQVSFGRATFGGYDMQQVDEFLEPLTEDYVTLYKENALLKSKMRILVGKLEEYRKNEASMKEAVSNAQATANRMIQEAEAKCARMTSAAANAAPAAQPSANAAALVAAENARVEEARRSANARIAEIQEQMRSCIQALERIKGNAPAEQAPAKEAAPAEQAPQSDDTFDSDAVANQISQNLEALVGTTAEVAPKAPPKHPVSDTTTSRFAKMDLQFGHNYNPTNR